VKAQDSYLSSSQTRGSYPAAVLTRRHSGAAIKANPL
jgi:hypothetical protein